MYDALAFLGAVRWKSLCWKTPVVSCGSLLLGSLIRPKKILPLPAWHSKHKMGRNLGMRVCSVAPGAHSEEESTSRFLLGQVLGCVVSGAGTLKQDQLSLSPHWTSGFRAHFMHLLSEVPETPVPVALGVTVRADLFLPGFCGAPTSCCWWASPVWSVQVWSSICWQNFLLLGRPQCFSRLGPSTNWVRLTCFTDVTCFTQSLWVEVLISSKKRPPREIYSGVSSSSSPCQLPCALPWLLGQCLAKYGRHGLATLTRKIKHCDWFWIWFVQEPWGLRLKILSSIHVLKHDEDWLH
jgi:hypothetical protein